MDDRADRLESLLVAWKEAAESANTLKVLNACQERLLEARRQLELAGEYYRKGRLLFIGSAAWFAISAAIWFAM